MNYANVRTPVGKVHLLASEQGLAALYFERQVAAMEQRFPKRERVGPRRNPWLLRSEGFLHCYFTGDLGYLTEISLDLRGTPFQLRVWQEIGTIEPGRVSSYGDLARRLGRPKAVRAVGAAVGRNPLSLLIPCHRVIGADGSLTGYAGGMEIKRFLLTHERENAASQAAQIGGLLP